MDRGGTFTDVIGCDPRGRLTVLKLLSDDPRRGEDAALAGIRALLRAGPGPLPVGRIEEVRIGTTVATNALLERKGAPTLLVTNAGLEDAPAIGDQTRPELFALKIDRLPPLHTRVLGVTLRVDAGGAELAPLDQAAAVAGLRAARAGGCTSCAICLLHAWRYPQQECRIAALAVAAGFDTVVCSHRVSPLIGFLARADSTVVEAYLRPVLERYTRHLGAMLPGVRLLFMKSDGGLAAPAAFNACHALLSGPAGGVVGAVATARRAGFSRIIGFDMGGTSTDVCYFECEFERRRDSVVAGRRVTVPALALETVAAGGGSVVGFDGQRLTVGPESAGADPGPAAYRRGGPLTITDCNLLLGRIRAEFFPHVFGDSGDQPPDTGVVRERFAALSATIARDSGRALGSEQIAAGALRIAVEHMASAIQRISIARGHDPTQCVLNCFGGAGGQHACQVAEALGIRQVLIHRHAGVLSALGIGGSELSALRERGVERPFPDGLRQTLRIAEALEREVRAALLAQGAPARVCIRRAALLRYGGSETALPVPLAGAATMRRALAAAHRRLFGFTREMSTIVIAAVRVEGRSAGRRAPAAAPAPAAAVTTPQRVRAWFDGRWRRVPLYHRDALVCGTPVRGPAIIVEPNATTVVEPGWTAQARSADQLVLRWTTPRRRRGIGVQRDPIALEVMGHAFMAAAEQMGEVLRACAQSVNVRERLDFSCALFAGDGSLTANAPHVPVHLGAMSQTVRTLLAQQRMAPGEVWVTNDPYRGGTHLPDVTVVTPVFVPGSGAAPDFLVASRAHHADLGGTTPGSMPPDSRRIEDEGVLIPPTRLVAGGRFDEQGMLALLRSGPHPARNPQQNLADLRAQVAANERGRAELERLVACHGLETVRSYMRYVNEQAADAVRRVIGRLPAGGHFRLRMDNGGQIAVTLRPDAGVSRLLVDFTGTGPAGDDNFNAPVAVVRAAVLYVLRTLVDEPIPLNDGCLAEVDIRVPPGSLLAPVYPAAVVAGNVEVSQCLCDALLAAAGALAASQGTMNNLSFGDACYQHYETLAGGAGAGPGFDGASAVHTHMTNSRLTDPEILESRYPVRLERFAIRHRSGGRGRFRGGDGLIRRIRFCAPMTVAILSNRRDTSPYGLAGGGAGRAGVNRLLRADGRVQALAYADRADVALGDAIEIATPGGGGFGAPSPAGGRG
ncbi:MAG: hydantoinase B/oxoprolinase family protein [Gammaproteobacteria bacterium]|nr:hydantoinase B/oxoprolinase family protein [Gammaproteobacteria bacterium]